MDRTRERILEILSGLGFSTCNEYDIIFTKGDDKIAFLKKQMLYYRYKDVGVIINLGINKIVFTENSFRQNIKSFYLDNLYYPFIFDYLEETFPSDMRKYKIKKILKDE